MLTDNNDHRTHPRHPHRSHKRWHLYFTSHCLHCRCLGSWHLTFFLHNEIELSVTSLQSWPFL